MDDISTIQEQVKKIIAAIENSGEDTAYAFMGSTDSEKDQAEKLIAKPDLKKSICVALKSLSNDVYGISEKLTPVLVTVAIANPALMPLNPLVFAWVAILISRAGVNTICAD